MLGQMIDQCLARTKQTCRETLVCLHAKDDAQRGPAQPGRRTDQSLQHRRKVKGRAADGLEHVGSRGLLLQGFREVSGRGPDLLKQARVLDGDHGLVGEGLGKGNLAFVIGVRDVVTDRQDAHALTLLEQGQQEQRACSRHALDLPFVREQLEFGHVREVEHLLAKKDA